MSSLRDRFAALVRDGDRTDLGRAALEIARLAYPDLDAEAHLAELDTLGDGLRRRLGGGSTTAAAAALADHLGGDAGFRGNVDDYYDPQNSFLNDVLRRRLGIPITLSVVFLEVGRRAGLALEGVGFPGHFLVRLRGAPAPLLLDPFHGGKVVGLRELRALLLAAHGGRPPETIPSQFLEPTGTLDILARMLRNLLRIYVQRKDHATALAAVDLVLVLLPDSPADLRARGLLYERLECFSAAREDFRRYLALAPDAPDVAEMRARVSRLGQMAPTLH